MHNLHGNLDRISRDAAIFARRQRTWGWTTAEAWLVAARQRTVQIEAESHDRAYVKRVTALDLSAAGERLKWLCERLEPLVLPCRYCHNDLSNTNVLHDAATGELQLIDFEFGGWNYRAFDLATHLSHWAGGAIDGRYEHGAFPGELEQRQFLGAYAEAVRGSEGEASCTVDDLIEEVRLLVPLAHCVWGLWAVCSLPASAPAAGSPNP